MSWKKNLKSRLHGFLWFRVRSPIGVLYYRTYSGAERMAKVAGEFATATGMPGVTAADGLHIFKGWRCFWMQQIMPPPRQQPTFTVHGTFGTSAEKSPGQLPTPK